MKKLIFGLFFLMLFFSFLPGDEKKDEIQSIRQERTDTLRFGIDSEVISLINTLKTEKNSEFNDLILSQAEKALNQDLIAAAFELFNTLDYRDAEDLAVRIIEDYDLYRSGLITSVLVYLKKDMNDKNVQAVIPLLTNRNAAIVRAAVDALGASGDESHVSLLMDLFDDPDFPEDVKSTILVSLGNLGHSSAAGRLSEIALDEEERAAWRWYAAQALGRIGLEESFEVLRSLLGDSDPNLRSFAVEGIGAYQTPQAETVLIDALRDSFWKVRVSAAQQLGERNSKEAVDILIYKAKSDPENNVKKEAIVALGKIGHRDGFELLRDLAGKKSTNPAIWLQAVTVLVENDLRSSLTVLEKMINDDWNEENSYYLNNIAKLFSEKDDASYLSDIFGRFMEHKNMVIKIYGIRGAERNRLGQHKDRITELSQEGNPRSVRQAALNALEHL